MSPKRRRSRAAVPWPVAGALVALALAAAAGLPALFPFLGRLESHLVDLRLATLTPAAEERDDVVLVAVTEGTLAQPDLAYRSPVDRGQLALWVEALVRAEPRALVLDMFFDQRTEEEKDERLRAVLAGASVPMVVAWGEQETSVEEPRRWLDRLARLVARQPPATGSAGGLTEQQAAFQEAFLPDNVIRAHADLVTDGAGVVRWVPAAKTTGDGGPLPSLAAAAATAAGAAPPPGELEIAYRGNYRQHPTYGFRVYEAHMVPFLPADWFAGRVVIVGAGLPWTDRHRTPFSAAGGAAATLPGALVHSHALAQILDGRSAPRAGLPLALAATLVLVVAGLGIAAIDRSWPLKTVLVALVAAGFLVGGFALYQRAGLMLPLVTPIVGLATAYGLTAAYTSRRNLAQKREIRRAFGHYLAPEVVSQLEEEPERLELGGEERELTYVFTDIAGFTSLSEKLAREGRPDTLVELLNEYLDGMCAIILEHRGTIDKFIGDATVSVFNAPEPQTDHAELAVRCALGLDRFAQGFSERQQEAGLEFGITRIGVHTGRAVIGNFGGRKRFDYTAIGDTVNTAARLEGANKYFGTRVAVSGDTVARCTGIEFRPVGEPVLKGRSEQLTVYEPLAEGALEPDAVAGYLAAYERLQRGDADALGAFRDLAARYPDDRLIAMHLERLERGESGPRIVLKGK